MKATFFLISTIIPITLAKFSDLVIPYYPHPTDCSKYVLRDWGTEVIFDCQSGLHWNNAKKTCDYPWRSGCSAQSKAIVLPLDHYFIPCPTASDSSHPVYFQHPDRSKYYLCSALELLEFSCDSGCEFNVHSKRCECNPTTEKGPSMTGPGGDLDAATRCPSKMDPKNPVFFPHPNCAKFYVCTLKGPMEVRCNDGLHWSIIAQRCERPMEAGCAEMGSTTTSTSSAPTSIAEDDYEDVTDSTEVNNVPTTDAPV